MANDYYRRQTSRPLPNSSPSYLPCLIFRFAYIVIFLPYLLLSLCLYLCIPVCFSYSERHMCFTSLSAIRAEAQGQPCLAAYLNPPHWSPLAAPGDSASTLKAHHRE